MPRAMHASNRTAIVVGAGIVGVCTALELTRRGIRVTLIDREEPGTQCSYGNAGRIASGLCTPRSLPGMVWDVPGMLRDPGHPLKTSAGHLLRSLPWFVRFLRNGKAERAEAIADALHALLSRAEDAFATLADDPPSRSALRRDGALYVYRNRATADKARAGFAYPRRRGIAIEELDGGAVRELEPALPADITHGFYRPGEQSVVNPLRLTQALAGRFAAEGGRLVQDEVRGLEPGTDLTPRVHTSNGLVSADTVVVAAGAWSGRLARTLGVNLPVQAERGYHVMLPESGVELRRPVHFGDRLVSFSPMEEGLRVVSGAEFAPLDQPANWRRLEPLLAATRDLFPEAETRENRPWMGARPSLPDSLPAIGASTRHADVLFACGHGQLGLTLAPITAKLIGQLATGEHPDVDLVPYHPDRFTNR